MTQPMLASSDENARSEGETPRRAPEGIRCDFCGEVVPRVRRVAVDADYERLQTPHKELYACPPCSDRKEKARLGLSHR